ncbi:hypothetical protein B0T25DRAFT_247531 [Lasiosphaeria hispida]|uniref:Uncharacterized protein n=1 Tax=Lasiosphaeria hispida TaxID=260671 RepID=A0AAJ0MCX0_9PEZI|nr:hypothetical protein B0T25DRAFT_247531 [Lasiosphaeria hispida]
METTVPKYTSAREAWVTKFALRSVSLMLCIIVLGISGTISFAIYARGAFLFGIAAPSLMLAACWDVAEGIAILARDGHRGIHPGANVGMDLVIWLAFAVTEFFLFLSGLENDPASFVRYYDDNNYSYTTGSYDIETDGPQSQEELGAVIADMSRKGKAIIGCMVILM